MQNPAAVNLFKDILPVKEAVTCCLRYVLRTDFRYRSQVGYRPCKLDYPGAGTRRKSHTLYYALKDSLAGR